MAKEKHICCICGKEFEGWGNNPDGAINENYEPIVWGADDVCCDECDGTYVLSGRLYLYNKARKEAEKDGKK